MNGNKRSPFLTAFFNPLNLAMLALIAAAGLCSAWWLFPAGLLLWLVMFILVYRDPALRLNNIVESRVTLAQRFQARFDRIEKTQITLFNAISSASRGLRASFKSLQEAVNRLIDLTYRLSLRMSNLENHLVISRTNRNPQADLDQLNEKIAAATDPAVKRDYEGTRQALEAQVKNLDAISATLDRFEAQLAELSSALEGVVTDAVRLQALGKSQMRRDLPVLLQIIRDQVRQLNEFDKEI